jgi:hypothetical protein
MMETWNLDDSIENADWTKQSWDLPSYKSPEFMQLVAPTGDLTSFRKLPVYAAAVAKGLIYDDEWVANYVQEGGSP